MQYVDPQIAQLIASLTKENKQLKDKEHMLMAEKDVLKQNCLNLTKTIVEKETEVDKQLDSYDILPPSSLVKSLRQSNQELNQQNQSMSIENEQLRIKLEMFEEIIQLKMKEVDVLQQRVHVLEEERKRFIDAKEETYSSLVQELLKEIEMLSEKVQKTSMENKRLTKEVLQMKKEKKIEIKTQREERIKNQLEEQSLLLSVVNERLIQENQELRGKNQELKEVVQHLELERKCNTEQDMIKKEKEADESDERRKLSKENSKLKEEILAWRQSFAMMIETEKRLRAEIDTRKKRSGNLSKLAQKEKKRRKLLLAKYTKLVQKIKVLKRIWREKERVKNQSTIRETICADEHHSSMQDSSSTDQWDSLVDAMFMNDIHELVERNEHLVELVEFLENERKCALEEIEEIKQEQMKKDVSRIELENKAKDLETRLKSSTIEIKEIKLRFDSLKKSVEGHRLEREDLERSSESMQRKYEDMKANLEIGSERSSALKVEAMEYEKAIGNKKKSLNRFKTLFCRRK